MEPTGITTAQTANDSVNNANPEEREFRRSVRPGYTPQSKAAIALGVLALVAIAGYFVSRRQSYAHRMDLVDQAGNMQDVPSLLAKLREAYGKTSYVDVKERILLNLGHYRDAESMPIYIDALKKKGRVRRAAAMAIIQIGLPAAEPARAALVEALPKTSAVDRAPVVWALTLLREPQAADAIIKEFERGTLQYQEGFSPRIISDALGTGNLTSARLLESPNAAVRELAAQALGTASGSAGAERSAALLKLFDSELARPAGSGAGARSEAVLAYAAAGVARVADETGCAKLAKALEANRDLSSRVLKTIESEADARGLGLMLKAASRPELRYALAARLAGSHDPLAAEPLAALLSDADPKLRWIAAKGLSELGDARAQVELIAVAKGSDTGKAREALTDLRDVATSGLTKNLAALLKEQPSRRADILRALGKTGDRNAANIIRKELKSDDVRSAAFALADLKDASILAWAKQTMSRPAGVDFKNLSAANEDAYRDRMIALEVVQKLGLASLAPGLMRIIEDEADDMRLREAAADALGRVGDQALFVASVAKVGNTQLTPTARGLFARSISWFNPGILAAEVNQLTALFKKGEPNTVLRSLGVAIGYAGTPEVQAKYESWLDDEALRTPTSLAVILSGTEASLKKLRSLLVNDSALRLEFQEAFAKDRSWYERLDETSLDGGARAVFARVRAAEAISKGDSEGAYSQVWTTLSSLLARGCESLYCPTPFQIRKFLVTTLNGENAQHRALAAQALLHMNERGLLLATRNRNDRGVAEAEQALATGT